MLAKLLFDEVVTIEKQRCKDFFLGFDQAYSWYLINYYPFSMYSKTMTEII